MRHCVAFTKACRARPHCSNICHVPVNRTLRLRIATCQASAAWVHNVVVKAVAPCALSAVLLLAGVQQHTVPANADELSGQTAILDLARVIPAAQADALNHKVLGLEQSKGWRVRVLTKYAEDQGPKLEELRQAWAPDDKTVVMLVDTSSPNIMQFRYGNGVLSQLRRPFFVELQSRYGNQFYVRDEGESAAVVDALTALLQCLEREGGCAVVPGLPQDQYYLTLACAVAGGFVFGFASLLEPQGFVQRRWVWLVLFAPLWFTLAVNFGIGPIVSRTSEPVYIVGNVAGFATAAGLVRLSPMFRGNNPA